LLTNFKKNKESIKGAFHQTPSEKLQWKKRTNEHHAKKQESLSRFLFRPQMKKKRSPILLKKKGKPGPSGP